MLCVSSLTSDFEAAAESVHSMTKRPSNEEFLKLYAMYKQGKFGDNDTRVFLLAYLTQPSPSSSLTSRTRRSGSSGTT